MTGPEEKPADYWFGVGKRWCWRCLRLTSHYRDTDGGEVCERCAQLRKGKGKGK